MGAFKSFDARDIIISPFVVNKSFSFYGNESFISGGLDKFIGVNLEGNFDPNTGGDILDYSFSIYKSQSNIFIPNVPNVGTINSYVVNIDNLNMLDNSTGYITVPQNSHNISLQSEFSGSFSFYSDSLVDTYIVLTSFYELGNPIPISNYTYQTQSSNISGLLLSSSFNLSFNWVPEVGKTYYIGSSVLTSTGILPLLIQPIPTSFKTYNVSLDIVSQSLAPSSSEPFTGINNTQYQRLIYNSVKQLYYTNYIGNPYPYPLDYTGSETYKQFDNFLQSLNLDERYFPTSSQSQIGVINIPSIIYGEYIKPKSFIYKSSSVYVYDDGNGNVLDSSDNKCGNIIYGHGLVILTSSSFWDLPNFISCSQASCSFSSSLTLYETQYKCNIRENEFNFSQNPTTISGSNGEVYGYVTSSYFDPYITSVGLYNENQDLLAVAKLSQPLPSSRTTDTNIIIRIDK